jgi:dolichol-phosphate mannosyltransferase
MYSRRLLQQVTIESTGGFELGLELTVKAYALGMPVAEVPTTWRDRTAGQSRFKLWKWLPRYLRWYRVGIAARFRTRP